MERGGLSNVEPLVAPEKQPKKEKFYVTFRDIHTGMRWSATYTATSYADAEQQADPDALEDVIISIERDYDVQR